MSNPESATPSRRIVIIGGVAGGMSCATRLRRLDERASIVVLEQSGYVSFANCGLPYFVGGVIEQRESLLLQTPEALAARFGLEVLVRTTATKIDPAAKTVEIEGPEGARTLEYDELVLSPGARPVLPPIPGIEHALALRTVEDTDALAAAVDAKLAGAGEGARAVVIGGGFIGLEVAENLVRRGMNVSVIEAQQQVMAPLDIEMAGLVHEELRRNGVDLRLGQAVKAIAADSVTVGEGEVIPADLVVAAIGVRPETSLAKDAGLAIGERGGIKVDERLQTSDPHIWAVGDAVEKIDELSGEASLVALANTANRQGRVLADILSGREGADRKVLGTAIVPVFDLSVASTGWSEKRLAAAGREFRVIHTHPLSHAGYYPGAETMALKLLVDPATDLILGAQTIGGEGVDKRIDVIATAMAGGITASGLADLELAYAPKYGSAKDAVNFLGYVDQNLASETTRSIQWHELEDAMASGAGLVDVRSAGEFANGAIPGAVNIPVDELRDRMDALPEGELIVHCAVGVRGHTAARVLAQAGREVRNLDGGYRTWKASPAGASA